MSEELEARWGGMPGVPEVLDVELRSSWEDKSFERRKLKHTRGGKTYRLHNGGNQQRRSGHTASIVQSPRRSTSEIWYSLHTTTSDRESN